MPIPYTPSGTFPSFPINLPKDGEILSQTTFTVGVLEPIIDAIGVNAARSKGIAGSYDAMGRVLTLVTYNVQEAPFGYVNSMWEQQKAPYGGDVLNFYNDGSPAPGVAPLAIHPVRVGVFRRGPLLDT